MISYLQKQIIRPQIVPTTIDRGQGRQLLSFHAPISYTIPIITDKDKDMRSNYLYCEPEAGPSVQLIVLFSVGTRKNKRYTEENKTDIF